MKKRILLVLLLIVGIFTITGCGSKENEAINTQNNSTKEEKLSGKFAYKNTNAWYVDLTEFEWVDDYHSLKGKDEEEVSIFLRNDNDKYYVCTKTMGDKILCLESMTDTDQYEDRKNSLKSLCKTIAGKDMHENSTWEVPYSSCGNTLNNCTVDTGGKIGCEDDHTHHSCRITIKGQASCR